MVEINGEPRIKLSQEVGKVTIPGSKIAYRLYGADGYALIDLLQKTSEEEPQVMQKILCRHPFQQTKRANVTPSRVEPLHKVFINHKYLNKYNVIFACKIMCHRHTVQIF